MRVKSESVYHLVMSTSLWPHGMCQAPPWGGEGESPGKDIGVACHSFLQGIFPTWGLNRNLLHCSQILYYLSHQGNNEISHIFMLPGDYFMYVLLHKHFFLNIQITEINWMCPFNPQHLWEKILKARSSHWTVYVCDNYNELIGREKNSWSIDTKAFSSSALTSIYGNVLNS